MHIQRRTINVLLDIKIRDGFVELTVDKTRGHILDKGGGQYG